MKHIKTTIAALMARARASRGYKPEINFFDDMPQQGMILDEIKQYKVHKDFFTSTRQLRYHERANWAGTDPHIKAFAGYLCEALREKEIPMYCHTAYRSPALQKHLKASGNSTLNSGPHQRGAAVDIVHSLYHWRMSKDMWQYIGDLGHEIISRKSLPMEWGGNFKSLYDPAHWQLKEWRQKPIIDPIIPEQITPYSLKKGAR
jgi:hypothetical protein